MEEYSSDKKIKLYNSVINNSIYLKNSIGFYNYIY